MIDIIRSSYLIDKNEFFIPVFNHEELEKKPAKVLKGVHFDFVEVEIICARLEPEQCALSGEYELVLELAALSPLPIWFNVEDTYDYFENSSVEALHGSDDRIDLDYFKLDFEFEHDFEVIF